MLVSTSATASTTQRSTSSTIPMEKDTIYYLYDPLCGWCYGFSPVMQAFEKQNKDNFHFEIISGGMMTGSNVQSYAAMKNFISGAYKRVENGTGIKFGEAFLKALDKGTATFSSTEPSIVLEVFKSYQPENAIAFASNIQKAIYLDGIEPTVFEQYKPYVEKWGIDFAEFLSKTKEAIFVAKTNAGFRQSSNFGVSGFPTVILSQKGKKKVLVEGYASLEQLQAQLVSASKR